MPWGNPLGDVFMWQYVYACVRMSIIQFMTCMLARFSQAIIGNQRSLGVCSAPLVVARPALDRLIKNKGRQAGLLWSLLTTIKSVSTTTGRVDSAVLAIPVIAWPMFSTFHFTAWALRSITFTSFSFSIRTWFQLSKDAKLISGQVGNDDRHVSKFEVQRWNEIDI